MLLIVLHNKWHLRISLLKEIGVSTENLSYLLTIYLSSDAILYKYDLQKKLWVGFADLDPY